VEIDGKLPGRLLARYQPYLGGAPGDDGAQAQPGRPDFDAAYDDFDADLDDLEEDA
jgi:hypothetical protein